MTIQYVQCKFRPEDKRAYTYSYDNGDGEPLNPGDIVKVADRSGDGWKRVTVVSISDEAPSFPCKPILGLYNPDLEPETAAAPPVDPAEADDLLDGKPLPF